MAILRLQRERREFCFYIVVIFTLSPLEEADNPVSHRCRDGLPSTFQKVVADHDLNQQIVAPNTHKGDWIKNNRSNLKDSNPTGTGEFDYAFLALSSGAKNLPSSQPYLPLDQSGISIGNPVTAIGYPAGHLDGQSVSKDLHRIEDTSTVDKTYSFGYTAADLLIAETDAIAQRGSSGGAVIGVDGHLDGIISTSIPNSQTGHTSLAALSTVYISKDYYNAAGKNLSDLFSGNPQEKYSAFESETGFDLAKILLSN